MPAKVAEATPFKPDSCRTAPDFILVGRCRFRTCGPRVATKNSERAEKSRVLGWTAVVPPHAQARAFQRLVVEIDDLIERLKRGEDIPQSEIARALLLPLPGWQAGYR